MSEDRRTAALMLLGGTAGQAVYGATFRVGEARGRRLDWPETWPLARRPWVVATTHPSAVLRADDRRSAYEGLVADLRVVAGLLR